MMERSYLSLPNNENAVKPTLTFNHVVTRFIQFESLTIMKFEMVWRGADVPLMIGSVWSGGSGVLGCCRCTITGIFSVGEVE